mmetsp:Transcript_15048/g.15580  ORF Transcript_15048/g.15580 Transcript_15048/m.15580 type:complete len:356 (+) Transcript_15048:1-1068(+)
MNFSDQDFYIHDFTKYNTSEVEANLDYTMDNFFVFLRDQMGRVQDLSVKEASDLYIEEHKLELGQMTFLRHGLSFLTTNSDTKIKRIGNYLLRGNIGKDIETSMIAEGYIKLLEPYAEDIPIKLNTIAVEVSYDKYGARVKDKNNNVHTADFVIVTVPLSLLKADKISFNPPLSIAKKNAIQSLGVFDMNKIIVEFKSKFWGDNDFLTMLYSEKEFVYSFAVNYHKVIGKNVLIFMVSGKDIEYLEDKPHYIIKEEIVELLKKYFPAKKEEIVITQFEMTNWRKDEFALGSFSELEADPKLRKVLGTLEGRVILAGEHTSVDWNTFVYGAFTSGIKAAEIIIDNYDKYTQMRDDI